MEGIQTLKGSWLWPWPSIRPYGISSCSSHRPLPIYQLSFKLKKLFVDGRTYGRTEVRTFFPSILLGRLSEVDLKTDKHKKSRKSRLRMQSTEYQDSIIGKICRRSMFSAWSKRVGVYWTVRVARIKNSGKVSDMSKWLMISHFQRMRDGCWATLMTDIQKKITQVCNKINCRQHYHSNTWLSHSSSLLDWSLKRSVGNCWNYTTTTYMWHNQTDLTMTILGCK